MFSKMVQMCSRWGNLIKTEVFVILTYFPIEIPLGWAIQQWLFALDLYSHCERWLRKGIIHTFFLASSIISDFFSFSFRKSIVHWKIPANVLQDSSDEQCQFQLYQQTWEAILNSFESGLHPPTSFTKD